MDRRTAIKAALCIIAAVASTSAFAGQLRPSVDGRRIGDVRLSRGELSDAPLHATAPGTPDDFDPRPENVLPTDKLQRERKAPPSEIKLDITLTMRRPRIAGGRHRVHRRCR